VVIGLIRDPRGRQKMQERQVSVSSKGETHHTRLQRPLMVVSEEARRKKEVCLRKQPQDGGGPPASHFSFVHDSSKRGLIDQLSGFNWLSDW
jgi:hypothetical protein